MTSSIGDGDMVAWPTGAPSPQVLLRPLATPLPLGLLGLFLATTGFAPHQLGWLATSQWHTVALAVIVSTVPLQLIACVIGFLARDPAAATGRGFLAGAWAAVALVTLNSPPGTTSSGPGHRAVLRESGADRPRRRRDSEVRRVSRDGLERRAVRRHRGRAGTARIPPFAWTAGTTAGSARRSWSGGAGS
jgi:hypothetical protein